MRDSMLYSLHNSKINSPESDFAPCFVEDKLIFASARAKGKGKKNIYAWNDQSYLNLYNSEIVEKDSSLRRPEVWENKANSRFHEGTATYNAAETMMYFTRNNYNKGKKSKSKSGNHQYLRVYSHKNIQSSLFDLPHTVAINREHP